MKLSNNIALFSILSCQSNFNTTTTKIVLIIIIIIIIIIINLAISQSAGTVEYIDCFSAEE